MNIFLFLSYLFCANLLIDSCLSQDITDSTTCVTNELKPDDENTDGVFTTFLEKLEVYTGLGEAKNFNVTLEGCENRICNVNSNGAAIWDARMDLYSSHMSRTQTDEAKRKVTLDGCLCYSENLANFQDCMQTVRESMIEQLDTVLLVKFKSILNTDCSLFDENCLIE